MQNHIRDTGISVVYEPENCSPAVDIIIVHGLHGHPYKSWTRSIESHETAEPSATSQSAGNKESQRSAFHRAAARFHEKLSKVMPQVEAKVSYPDLPKNKNAESTTVFWPADLLPEDCPNSRILMFGYDSKITKYSPGLVNENSVLSHSKDLLFSLARERTLDRPLICLAHSLGGIIIKEMLAKSSSSKRKEHKNVVESTAAVVFLGTPHRGSLDVAAIGEVVRSIVSTLGMKTTPALLDALGLKTTDLERAQEEFSRLWQKHDFRVKTFQEGLSLAKIGKKVVPHYSSLIGDHREYAETLQANHMEMCRYSGTDDENYRKVAGELHSIYDAITKLNMQKPHQPPGTRHRELVSSVRSSAKLAISMNGSQGNQTYLQSLWFPAINTRLRSLEGPAGQTCHWLFKHDLYQDWFHGRNKEKHQGLLWLKGKPGAGKSTLMREAFCRAALGQANSDYRVASFFFSAKGDILEHSPLGLYRSLLHQLLPGDRESLQQFHEASDAKRLSGGTGAKSVSWNDFELKEFFESMFTKWSQTRTLIFVDALDECDSYRSLRDMAFFLRRITKSAHDVGVDLNIFLSSRHFPGVTVSACPEIIVEQHNSYDIATYVEQRDWDDGKDIEYLTRRVENVPGALQTLFTDIFSNLSSEKAQLTVRFFQWAILATKPLRLHEWHHIMAFIREPTPSSLSEWRMSDNFTRNDAQLERQIRSVSRGLVEVMKIKSEGPQDMGIEKISLHAGAGSFDLEYGDTRIVQVIHESVRDFFLRSDGFSILDPNLEPDPISKGHLSIMATCLDYLNITELDALVQARTRAGRRVQCPPTRRFPDVATTDSTDSSRFGAPAISQDRLPDNAPAPYPNPAFEGGTPNFSEMLRSSDPTPKIDIIKWMADNISLTAESISPSEPSRHSSTHFSDTRRSQILEAHPALLSYAAFSMFRHARRVKVDKVNPSPIVKRLEDKATWARWVALREDVAEDTTLFEYVRRVSIFLWLPFLTSELPTTSRAWLSRSISSDEQGDGNYMETSGRRRHMTALVSREHSRAENSHFPSYKPRRRPGSVASFGSASSHDR
ncbi:hypothetical protein BKA56DRAFT_616585 [Ilyonectria sp. MPI-CAGE-AT-0026]|nr:hypothetical protein BKA56DRAFT_616585 [Ilyonectria sp. MPI-CAGE-AT-0026]